jgi:membrane-associated phospholipid phosphatase
VVPGLALTTAPVRPPAARSTSGSRGGVETAAGAVLVIWTALAGIALHGSHGPNRIDRWGFSLLARQPHSLLLVRVTELGDPAVLVVGSALAALVAVRRDRWRAAACLCGPVLAAVLVEWVVKPWVGRRYLEVLTFPSGSVTTIAAVSTAWVLAVPARLRWVAIAAGAVLVVAMGVAVVGLRWHYPTDALGGAAFGVGVVLMLDGLLHLAGSPATSGGGGR